MLSQKSSNIQSNNKKSKKYYLAVEDSEQTGGRHHHHHNHQYQYQQYNPLHKIFPPIGGPMPLYNDPMHSPGRPSNSSVIPIPMAIGVQAPMAIGVQAPMAIGVQAPMAIGVPNMNPFLMPGQYPFFPRKTPFTPGVIDVTVPGSIPIDSYTSVIVGPPIIHLDPFLYPSNKVTFLSINSDKYKFKLEFPYSLLRSIIDDIYKVSANVNQRNVSVRISTPNYLVDRNILTSDNAIIEFIQNISKYAIRPSFKDLNDNIVNINDLIEAIKIKIGNTSNTYRNIRI
jgi:hypothetical protein